MAIVNSQPSMRVMGGSLTTIQSYPYVTSLLRSTNLVTYVQTCAGTILTTRSIMSAAHCFIFDQTNNWRIRAGSSSAHSGGTVYYVNQIIIHKNFDLRTYDSNIAILRTASPISIVTNTVHVATIPSSIYNLPDNQAVWAVGWGTTSYGGSKSEQLRHVQIWTVNQQQCANSYRNIGFNVTSNMLCAGWFGVGGRDQCQNDAGGPLIHNSVVVGISSWGYQCGLPFYPGINTRVSRFTPWIQQNA
ncbi:trypsin CFT-1-like [Melitaea cinxia]|uniref:trypsin CFT-1-like n=1 Tax=Melitaea cinxia TaxID=113334 RepID=UPI001E26F0BF|nr:trypsin CFT-1-like [Melitaea cinxia]